MDANTTMKETSQAVPQLVTVDSRGRVRLGKGAQGLYRVIPTKFGYILEQVEVVSQRDQELRQNQAFWDRATESVGTDNFEPLEK